MSTIFDFDDKEDLPSRVKALQGVPEKYWIPAEHWNLVVRALRGFIQAGVPGGVEDLYKGRYANLNAVELAHPTPTDGAYAYTTSNSQVIVFIALDTQWNEIDLTPTIEGFDTVDDITARNNIPTAKRKIGMRRRVVSEGKDYQLVNGIQNTDWVEFVYGLPASPLPPYANIAAMLADQINQIEGYVYIAGTKAYVKLAASTASISDYFLVSAGKFVDGTNPLDAVYLDGSVGIGTNTPMNGLVDSASLPIKGIEITSDNAGNNVPFLVFDSPGLGSAPKQLQVGIDSADGSKILDLGGGIVFETASINIKSVNGTFHTFIGTNGIHSSRDLHIYDVFTTIDPSAKFEISSTTKGSIPFPRMTEAQRLAIPSPATGLHVYQLDGVSGVYVYDGAWYLSGTRIPRLRSTLFSTNLTINSSSHGLSYYATTNNVLNLTLSNLNVAGMLCSVNSYGENEYPINFDSATVDVLGYDPANGTLKLQRSLVTNGFTGISIECLGVVNSKVTYKVYGNVKQSI
jgi:hypothetical protein